ncbi:hypothetical protein MtrunA17_Chr3g0134961 [Medicago truncatula]|uniref:Retrotransposon gag domain-containing protein n=2 Tax=Medicago truncatula TaxID=3880 RepID=A0A396IXF5_MEDTR|nr:uncharacterized protein LOC112420476 isoform X2 [Medicago truncatula]RHN70386.1 hypothetical protein MtrunA17_Chr3g0134961 [Medicago truncatula]
MWGYIDETVVKPTDKKDADKYAQAFKTWMKSNSKIITWINNSIDQSIGVQLAKFDTAKEIWDHLKRLYVQSNFAKRYQLESDIMALKQNNMTIQEFYSAMTNLWDQLALMESDQLKVVKAYINQREEQRLVWFLMALRDDFEGLRGGILHRTPLPNVESVVSELLAEEFDSRLIPICQIRVFSPLLHLFLLLLLFKEENLKGGLGSVTMNVLFANKKFIGKYNVQN